MAPIEHMGTAGVPGSAGRIVPNTVAKIVKVDGTLAGFDEPGELVVTGPQMALRYANNDKACVSYFSWFFLRSDVATVPRRRLSMAGFTRATK